MPETEYAGPLTADLNYDPTSLPTFEWTTGDSLDYDVSNALVNSLDMDYEDFVLQDAIDMDALAKVVGADPDSTTPTDVLVSFRLESCDCTVLVDGDGQIQVWNF